jgi:hypothetical protein
MKREDLSLFAKGCYDSLKEQGRVILLADRHLNTPPFFSKFNNPEEIAFPVVIKDRLWMKIIAKKDLEQQVYKNLYASDLRTVKKVVNLNVNQRHEFFELAACNQPEILTFFKAISRNLSSHLVNHSDSYERDVCKAFEEKGFKVIECGYREKTLDLPPETPIPQLAPYFNKAITNRYIPLYENKYYSNDLRVYGRLLTKKFDRTRVHACFHTIVLEKNMPKE